MLMFDVELPELEASNCIAFT